VIAVALSIAAVIHLQAGIDGALAPPDAAPASDTLTQPPPLTVTEMDWSAGRLPTAAPERLMTGFAVATPFVAGASLPRRPTEQPSQISPTPSPAPEPPRAACDPAYPDDRTCIPPGPPFDQGCAITSERRFTVLAPDPQGLDHDNDGIGCEPIKR
jgi:hypothetical protein